jgi:RNA ligase
MFKVIETIDDVRPFVADKKEIRFRTMPNGVTMGCYLFADSHTFDSPEAVECRGIAFGPDGRVCSRPLHKFFNAGENESVSLDALRKRDDLVAVFEKLDGSMIATALVGGTWNNGTWGGGTLAFRSKKVFDSSVVKLTEAFLALPENEDILTFAAVVARNDMTAIFELTHPDARIVVAQDQPQLRLLHVRDNQTGKYVTESSPGVRALIKLDNIPMAPRYPLATIDELLAKLENMEGQEGFILQYANGDMVKLKCPWYNRLHRSITFLRERDIALSAINEELDDLKAVLVEAGVDLTEVNAVEKRLVGRLLEVMLDIEDAVTADQHLDRKAFALKHKGAPLFGLMMTLFTGGEPDVKGWYSKHKLKDEFSLRVLADEAVAEAIEG